MWDWFSDKGGCWIEVRGEDSIIVFGIMKAENDDL